MSPVAEKILFENTTIMNFQTGSHQSVCVGEKPTMHPKIMQDETKPVFNKGNFHRFLLQAASSFGSKPTSNNNRDCSETDSESDDSSSSSSFNDFPLQGLRAAEIRTRRVTRRSSLKCANLHRRMLWLEDTSLVNKAVFWKRFNYPAITIQKHFRGMQQRKLYNKIHAKVEQLEEYACIKIQTMVRGFMYLIKLQFHQLQHKVQCIESKHEMELVQIQQQKQVDMERIYREVVEEAMAKEKELEMLQNRVIDEVFQLRDINTKLGTQNKILKKATSLMAKKNKKSILLMEQTNSNIQQLEATILNLEADSNSGDIVMWEWKHRIEQYETALHNCECQILVEQNVCRKVQFTIANVLQIAHEYLE